MLSIVTAASDRSLLTAAQMRAAVGLEVGDASQDVALARLGAMVSDAIARDCCLTTALATPPTLRQETLTEVFRPYRAELRLTLSRRPATSVSAVVSDGVTLETDEYELDGTRNALFALSDDTQVKWAGHKITVSYVAGWDTVPDALALAASKLLRMVWSEDGPGARSDPNLKSVDIEGVGRREWWVGGASDPLMSEEIRELLFPFRELR
jgi:hypothetical protein